ncbi:MAG: EpsG family protein [Clostridiales bacterium]|nr:EpsG family protein [Clostridiales bacterium]
MLLFMWVLFGFNLQSPDRASYEFMYGNLYLDSYYSLYEPGFTVLMDICLRLGLSFQGFQVVLATLYVLLIYASIRKYTKYTSYVLALFIIAPFLWYISGIRVALAAAIVIFSFQYLLLGGKKNTFYFCLGIVVSVLFHYSSCLYLLFLLGRKRDFKKRKILVILFLVTVLSVIILRTNMLYIIVNQFTSRYKTLQWFNNNADVIGRPSLIGAVSALAILFGNVYVTYMVKRYFEKHSTEKDRFSLVNRKFSYLVYNCNCAMLLLIPLILLNLNFFRPIYGLLILNACSVANMIDAQRRKRVRNRLTYDNCSIKNAYMSLVIIVWSLFIAFYQEYPCLNTIDSVYYIISKNLLFPF